MVLKFQQSSDEFLAISRVDGDVVLRLTDLAASRRNAPWALYPLVFKPVRIVNPRGHFEEAELANERLRGEMHQIATKMHIVTAVNETQRVEIEAQQGEIEAHRSEIRL